ncbi:MAG: hypothetical protein M3O92_00305 [Actinomycetota bacterium]|nr:hypothetical protein [Actinomycetota bacterium]
MPAQNQQPFVIVAGVTDVYVAPVGTEFPDVDAAKSTFGTEWRYLGHTDGGCKVGHAQTIVELRTDQVTAPVKGVRSEESLSITFNLAEVTPENYALALNQAIAGPTTDGDNKVVSLYRGGFGVETVAMLVRGDHLSPEGDFNLQYEVNAAYQSGSPEVDYVKDAKAVLACQFNVIAAEAFSGSATDADIFGCLRVGTS